LPVPARIVPAFQERLLENPAILPESRHCRLRGEQQGLNEDANKHATSAAFPLKTVERNLVSTLDRCWPSIQQGDET